MIRFFKSLFKSTLEPPYSFLQDFFDKIGEILKNTISEKYVNLKNIPLAGQMVLQKLSEIVQNYITRYLFFHVLPLSKTRFIFNKLLSGIKPCMEGRHAPPSHKMRLLNI